MTELYQDSNNLTKLIKDLQQVFSNTKDEIQKLAILDRILKALYGVKTDQSSTTKIKRSEITWWEGDYKQDHSREPLASRSDS